MGELHCVSCCSDSPLVVGIGGERELRVLNLQRNAGVCQHFGVTPVEQSVRARRRERSGETFKGPFIKRKRSKKIPQTSEKIFSFARSEWVSSGKLFDMVKKEENADLTFCERKPSEFIQRGRILLNVGILAKKYVGVCVKYAG